MKQQNIEIAVPIKVRKTARVFSREYKHSICTEWRASGLSKHRFCQQHNICQSMLTRWINAYKNDISPEKSSWIPIHSKEPPCAQKSESLSVKIISPNSTVLRTSVSLSSFLSILKEVCNATTIVRS